MIRHSSAALTALLAAMLLWAPLPFGGVTRWGENSMANYDAYLDFLVKWQVIKQKPAVGDVVTNDLLSDIDKFDPDAVTVEAKAYK